MMSHRNILSILQQILRKKHVSDTSYYCRVVRKLLKVAGLCAIPKEKEREGGPQRGSAVADHTV